MKPRDRNHDYLYTVEIRVETKAGDEWQERQVQAWNLEQAAHKLGVEKDDCRYVTKRIL